MPRTERKASETGIYHILLRGINKQSVFEEPEDYSKFIAILSEVKEISEFKLYAYCLMGNHAHLLLKEIEEPVSTIFRRVGARYVFWFNWKYGRSGHLFQDRFRSEPVESDEYFSTVLLYIYQNPVKAGICENPCEYEWCSRKSLGGGAGIAGIIDEAGLFDIISIDEIKKREREKIPDELLESKVGRKQAISDEEARELMKNVSGTENATGFQGIERGSQEKVFGELRKRGVSIRQFSRISGLSKGVCERMARASRDT